jgi:hypothetical protein
VATEYQYAPFSLSACERKGGRMEGFTGCFFSFGSYMDKTVVEITTAVE